MPGKALQRLCRAQHASKDMRNAKMARPLSDRLPATPDQLSASIATGNSVIANAMYRRNSVGAAERQPTYHRDANAQYLLPNDFAEHVRLETQAVHLSAIMNNRIFHAPVQDGRGRRMLDIGCGTGVVTDVMGDIFPRSECIGLDLSLVPALRAHPSNVRFFQGNVASQRPRNWTAENGGSRLSRDQELFDYVFSRLLVFGISNWPAYVRKQFDLLKPGGWAEIQEPDWEFYDGDDDSLSDEWPWLQRLSQIYEQRRGMDLHCGSRAQSWMRQAGFIDIRVFEYCWPFGGQTDSTVEMREFSQYSVMAIPTMLHHMIYRSLADSPLSEERRVLIERVRIQMRQCLAPEQGKHQKFYVTIGRRPPA